MAKRRQRIHTADFKFKLVLEALQEEKTRAEIAREHDIAKSLLYKWEQLFLEQGANVFRSTDTYQTELSLRNERIADLERVVGRLALENEVLKKFEMKLDLPLGRNGR